MKNKACSVYKLYGYFLLSNPADITLFSNCPHLNMKIVQHIWGATEPKMIIQRRILLLLGTKNVFWTDKNHRGITTPCMRWQAKDFQKQNTDCILLVQSIITGCLHPINQRLLKEMKYRSTSLLNVNTAWKCWIYAVDRYMLLMLLKFQHPSHDNAVIRCPIRWSSFPWICPNNFLELWNHSAHGVFNYYFFLSSSYNCL